MQRKVNVRKLELDTTNTGLTEQLKNEVGKYCVAYDSKYPVPISGYISEVKEEVLLMNRGASVLSFEGLEHVTVFDEVFA